jgi:hypothetical protein
MNRFVSKSRMSALRAFSAVAFTLVAVGASAQDTTTTNTRRGASVYQTNVRNAEIVYVEGNDLVLKLEDGKVEHLVVPSSEKFRIDGREVTVRDLKAGTKLSQTITTTTTPHYVKTVRVLKGKVWHVNAPHSVILTLPDNTNQLYKIPSHAKFNMNGKKISPFDLRKGMTLEATIVTDDEHTVVETAKSNVGYTPAPATPQFVDVLLFRAAPMPEPIRASVTAEHVDPPVEMASTTLPDTASPLPLLGLLGGLGIASSIGLGVARKRAAIKA